MTWTLKRVRFLLLLASCFRLYTLLFRILALLCDVAHCLTEFLVQYRNDCSLSISKVSPNILLPFFTAEETFFAM